MRAPPSSASSLSLAVGGAATLLALLLLPGRAEAACAVVPTSPPDGSVQVSSPLFRWGGVDCATYRVWFSPSGTFGADRTLTPWRTRKQYRMGEEIWDGFQAGAWAEGVYWKVQARDAEGAVAFSTVRQVVMDPDIDDDGVSVGAGDCDDDDGTVFPGAVEACNGIDDDCDGEVDPGCPVAPVYGDLMITEVMANPARVSDAAGSWIELAHTGSEAVDLSGVSVETPGGVHTFADGLVLYPGDRLVLAAESDPLLNGGVGGAVPMPGLDWSEGFRTGGDLVVVDPEGEVLFVVDGFVAQGTPGLLGVPNGSSLALDPDVVDPAEAGAPLSWCRGVTSYGAGDFGTPGAPNPACSFDEVPIGWGGLQFPYFLNVGAAAPDVGSIFGRVYLEGVTDQVGRGLGIIAQVGWGPSGSFAGDPAWVWSPAAYNMDYDGLVPGDLANDEYVGTFPPPDPGEWDYAFRFTADFGLNWAYCDLDGTDNAYDAAQAGQLSVE
ncbi:lamin tail domain-containing protein [Myxococcota bacterium]|nr:lamin tail domain-containing protein [Myxococcota bacterium]